jgi:hypothetical protein
MLVSTSTCAYEHEFNNLEQRPKFSYCVCCLKDLDAAKYGDKDDKDDKRNDNERVVNDT